MHRSAWQLIRAKIMGDFYGGSPRYGLWQQEQEYPSSINRATMYNTQVGVSKAHNLLDELHRASVGEESDFARWLRLEWIPKARERI